MKCRLTLVALMTLTVGPISRAPAEDVSALRLVPFPKKVSFEEGTFSLDRALVLEAPAESAGLIGRLIGEELKRAGCKTPEVRPIDGDAKFLRLCPKPVQQRPSVEFRQGATPEDYMLTVQPDAVVGASPGGPGVLHAAQTLCQIVRANRIEKTKLPCLAIQDWPALRWRCFQDDMTRGPSSTLDTLKGEVVVGSYLKMNLFTYYMECQYHFKKHPKIGPEDGSLEPEDLKALVAFSKAYYMDILGNQQSFAHFGNILKHDEYASVRENMGVLSPAKEESYELLDDLYSEVCPLLPFEMFNVCCDETHGLDKGPSKELAAEIGVGGVYVRHIRRIHDILKNKYNKRMMMWGDIILHHPDKLDQIPKDTVMLTWGYGARDSFEHQIIPFKESGYEFFVCPGISNWRLILPNFAVATTNIRNFVRDGAKLGAIGMLNTDWEDDGESLQGDRWHGHTWGAECAWNASTTTPDDFNRRVGAVLFGERGDHFGQAIKLLAQTHSMPGMQGMNNRRFWEDDFPPIRNAAAAKVSGDRLLAIVRPAIEHLEACKKEATVNADFLDHFLYGARRMELIGQRMLDGLEASELYVEAYGAPPQEALERLDRVEALARRNRDALESLGREFERLWLAECKPYALDWTMDRFTAAVNSSDELLARLAQARKDVEAGKPLPAPEKVGLAPSEAFARRTRPHKIETVTLAPTVAWADPSATHRLGFVVKAGPVDRVELPLELDVALPAGLTARPARAFVLPAQGAAQEIPAQLGLAQKATKSRLCLVIPGPIAQKKQTLVHVYLGSAGAASSLPEAVRTSDAPDGMKWIENDKVRLLLGPEGAHVYRWEVKALEGRDLTQPGQGNWAGLADVPGDHRNLPNTLTCTARGPALVQYECRDETGLVKTINVFAGTSWMEVIFNEPVAYFWNFDNPKNFAADGPTPGAYLFSNDKAGPVGKQADGVAAQVKAQAHWAVKFNPQKLALGMTTPEAAARFVLAPGSGAGGVGIEGGPPVGHFVTYAGLLTSEPKQQMEQLRNTLDFTKQPEVVLFAVEKKP